MEASLTLESMNQAQESARTAPLEVKAAGNSSADGVDGSRSSAPVIG
jgi:hypothetical protein